ncbi:H-NS histone family protein [Sansalvadorimonas sp. 2012CJ34-2]|uniref:H-NS histone family protein n=1 Tax=Parendozoicomonas callyspongiae TaxID=2942213 RepID=A0ABT0PEF6_9GAMM|nr:H-NS family nucleoid-associated regulatory protein [Sansalvadorimonas sp. 2012CJ34-2]MCL6269754.1 H-NS histone family protein [Sansalvadorimonas sp. 2012CJ34-2]
MNIFDEVMHRLSSKTRMRGLFRDVHVEDLERIVTRLQDVLEEKKAAVEEQQEKIKAKQNSIEVIKKMMDEKGISIEDFGSTAVGEKKKRNIKRYLFEFQDKSGSNHQWEGSLTGRAPKVFQEYLQRTGKERSDCIIEER